ncbi:chemotaxis protein CheW [Thermosediminibacter litoriperuensis]|uniref:Purine-binding chemotaxis protein CheW n=1 Tax=Thermosediminibacter litoriperuensis TaxID=291989 RepID=A0A5S5AUL1_9FIRM|nr:chemotaxis protein CheW [Thermosediminibacter litoriperuensis]TYP56131.1 purine-binding chemotaxis protein CheW [Thermosediminibacter litoriperuensis]
MASTQYVLFRLAGEQYGVPVQAVQEIIRLPRITRVPQAPHYVEGLANLRGLAISVVSGRKKFGLPDKEYDEDTRVLIITLGDYRVGYMVDAVTGVVTVDTEEIEALPQDLPNQVYFSGLLRMQESVIILLDPHKLLAHKQSFRVGREEIGRQEYGNKRYGERCEQMTVAAERQFVTFNVQGEEYGLDIAYVQEIVAYPEVLSSVPTFPHYAEGIMVLRDQLLPVINLAKLMCLKGEEVDRSRSRVIVLNDERGLLGIVVDNVSEVLRIDENAIEAMPEYLQVDAKLRFKGICKTDTSREKRLTYILDPACLTGLEVVNSGIGPAGRKVKEETATGKNSEGQYILFRLGEQDFITEITSVREILNVPEITRVPQAPSFVEGVINIRGNIIPVIDLRKRLEMGSFARGDQNRIIVVDIGNSLTGFIVDVVKEVKRIQLAAIETTGALTSVGLDYEYLVGIAKLGQEGAVALVLDLHKLLSRFEVRVLQSINSEAAKTETTEGREPNNEFGETDQSIDSR